MSRRRRATVELQSGGAVTRVEIDPEHAFADIRRGNNVWTR